MAEFDSVCSHPRDGRSSSIGIPDPRDKWTLCRDTAILAEGLGYDSIWVYDHFHNVPAARARGRVRVLDDDGRAR